MAELSREHQKCHKDFSHINAFVLFSLAISSSNADDCIKMDTTTTPSLHAGAIHAHGIISSNVNAAKIPALSSPSSRESSTQNSKGRSRGPARAGLNAKNFPRQQMSLVDSHRLGANQKIGIGDHDQKIGNDHGRTMMTAEDTAAMENDTMDTTAPQRQPLHTEVPLFIKRTPSVGFAASLSNEIVDFTTDTSPSNKPKRRNSPFGLTLSAFRRPENTVRIADMDTSRKITTEYDFDAPECRVLGHGASSTVRLAVRRKDGVHVAVKSVAKHEALRFRRMRHGSRRHLDEWELLRSLRDNPHVISLLDVYETDDEIQLVLEYCKGGELFDVIQAKRNQALASPDKVYRYSESKAAKIVLQMLSVLCELHSRGIVHRDVKPENILLSSQGSGVCAKLSDFGTSRELHPEEESDSCSSDGEASPLTPQSRKRAYSSVGSSFYAAPEVHAGHGYDTAVDMYSLGVTLYVLLCGFPPSFTTSEEDDVVTFPSSHWSNVSDDAKNLIRKMLESDASCRITAAEALQDAWIVRQTRSPVRVQARIMLSPSAPRPVVDMELVRSRLFKGLDSDSEEEVDTNEERLQKRRKLEQEPGLIEVIADLYEGLESAAASAAAAAAGVMMDGNDDIRVVEDMDERVEKDGPRVTSPFESSFTALSV